MTDPLRAAGACLLLFGLLTFVAPFLPSHAFYSPADPAADIAAFFRDDHALQTLQAWLHVGPALLLVAAIAILSPRLRDAGPRGPSLAATALVAAGAIVAIIVTGFFVVMAAIRGANEGFDPHVALLLYNTGWVILAFGPGLLAPLLLIPFGLLAREAGLPAWLRPVSLGAGALCVLVVLLAAHPLTQAPVFAGTMILLVWSIAAGAALALKGERVARAA